MSNPKPYEGHTPLLPCPNPWCEADRRSGDFSPEVISGNFGAHYVNCTSCSMHGPYRRNPIQAITAWNTRVNKGPAADAMASVLESLLRWFDADDEVLDAMSEDELADHNRQIDKITKALAAYREQSNG